MPIRIRSTSKRAHAALEFRRFTIYETLLQDNPGHLSNTRYKAKPIELFHLCPSFKFTIYDSEVQ